MKKQKKLNIKIRDLIEERHGWQAASPASSPHRKSRRARRVDTEPYRCRKKGRPDGQR